jgi:hypothetical protein
MSEKTLAVHIREPHDFKACRSPKGDIPDYPHPGWAGNPFILKNVNDDAERDEVIAKYRKYFYDRILVDKNFRDGILSLRGKRIACFCKPKACHTDVIVEYLDANVFATGM